MIRADIYISPEQKLMLATLPGTLSEHIRRAIDEYIEKLKSTTASASQSKKGGQNG